MKFCFFGYISGALKGNTGGGAELQIALLAKALALKKHEVVVIDPSATESFITQEGVQLLNVPGWNNGIPGIRLFLYRIPILKNLFIKQNADYYYVRMKTYMHLIPFWASRKINRKFIIALASDLETSSFFKNFKYKYKTNFNLFRFLTMDIPNSIVFPFLLKRADFILLQHSDQGKNLKKVRGEIIVFQNIFNFSSLPKVSNKTEDYFIIPGTLSVLKGVKNLIKLLKLLNNKVRIVIVGQPVDKKSEKIYQRLKKKEYITLKGRLTHNETIQLIANAKALINTSNFEGFPNIFLEAWATGVPVISLNVNPGNIFNKYDLGIYCEGDLNKMKESIELFNTYPINKEKLISYVSEFHDFSTAGDRFINLLTNSKNN